MTKYLTVEQVAEALNVTPKAVLAWVAAGELPASNVGRKISSKRPRWRVAADDLESFLARRKNQTPEPARRHKVKLPPVPRYV